MMREMARNMGALAAAGALLGAFFAGDAAFAQRSGGVLKVYFFDSPASMSIHDVRPPPTTSTSGIK